MARSIEPDVQDELAESQAPDALEGAAEPSAPNIPSLALSSIGFTVSVAGDATELVVAARWARYDRVTSETEGDGPDRVWRRIPMGGAVETSSVVLEVIRAANQRVLVVSFAAHGVDKVVRQLVSAADKGVRLDLVLETSVDEGGSLRGRGAVAAFADLAERANFWHWPAENRRGDVSLHAKIVVADAAVALMSSANLTNRGMSDNIEVGVLMADENIAGRLDAHFRSLMRPEARCLALVTPRDGTDWNKRR